MQDGTCKVVNFRILKIECAVDSELDGTEITLRADNSVEWQRTSEPADKYGRATIETKITSNDDKINVKVISQTVFDIEEHADMSDDDLIKLCHPIAIKRAFDAIKEITAAMGITPIDFTDFKEPGEGSVAD